ncbi:RIP metalloprotease RseP [Gudongella sp. DL1XJH-153]|uniref:RIP metalloprotease RseP n=1 Tax=Gudongella sp. DL1XJH-153 TaxID=3409804 RepID=UPI003BB773AB
MLTALAAIFVFLLVVLVHEAGHFTVAKMVGIRVNEFAIGMGPKLVQKIKGETKYTLRALPIGGYVKMEGEDESSNDPRSFSNVSVWSRIAVITAGAIMNFVLAIVVLSIVAFNVGVPSTTIGEIIDGSPAQEYGIAAGDRIVEIEGVPINNWDDIVTTINTQSPEELLEVQVVRNDEMISMEVMPTVDEGRVIIGIVPEYDSGFFTAIKSGFQETWYFLKLMFQFLGMLFQGNVSTNDLAGPVGVINEIGNAASMGFVSVLYILGFISINLGFFNLLPIPALDGSKIVFLLIELFRGKPIDADKEGFIHFIGFIFLISLMLIVTYKDLIRINLF